MTKGLKKFVLFLRRGDHDTFPPLWEKNEKRTPPLSCLGTRREEWKKTFSTWKKGQPSLKVGRNISHIRTAFHCPLNFLGSFLHVLY